jgi:hypothetical protein
VDLDLDFDRRLHAEWISQDFRKSPNCLNVLPS